MKKILLLIFTIMLTFSVTTVNVSAAEIEVNPSTEFTNILGDYGSFTSDSNSDGIADGFTLSNSSNSSITNGVQKVFASGSATFYGLYNTDVAFEIDHVYYATYDFGTNGTNYSTQVKIPSTSSYYELAKTDNDSGTIYGTVSIDGAQPSGGFFFYMTELTATQFSSSIYIELENFMIIDLTSAYGTGNEPTADEFHNLLKADYFKDTVNADLILDFDNNTRIDHYMYDVPNIFDDFPNNITMENIIRIAFFIPLMTIFYLLIPLFNFVLGGSASGSIMLGLLILSFILREVIRFIDPDFHLFGKNSYYDGYKSPTKKD